jgi:hypothetical protein
LSLILTPITKMTKLKEKYGLLIIGIILGVVYGIISRLVFGENATLASITYLFIIPPVLGIIPLMFADNEKLKSYRNIIFIPWITILSFFLTMLLFGIEDFLCLLVLSAPFFMLATIGALIFKIVQINKRKSKGKLMSLVLLPFLFAPIENYIKTPPETYTIKSEVIITAKPETIWDNIVEVKTIQNNEYNPGVFNYLGIPRPMNATVDKKSIGGKRIGNFEGGLKFVETITEYKENKKVAFKIKIDTETVGQKVFEQHVLNGNYFNFINATYELESTANGKVRLSLTSSYQLTSTINFYGKFWGDMILSDFQDRLLDVIETRCEKQNSGNKIYGK